MLSLICSCFDCTGERKKPGDQCVTTPPRNDQNSSGDHRPAPSVHNYQRSHPGTLQMTSDLANTLIRNSAYASSSTTMKEEYRHYLYDTLRIVVVGRSGAGKTTLIRLMVGKGGPRKLGTDAVAGTQNIEEEWRVLQKEGLPQLVFHDSNGMGVRGKESLTEVKNFIDSRNDSSSLPHRIHLIWYIISAADNRFADDGELMRVVLESNIPMLLIMTYNDLPVEARKQHVSDDNLDLLLKSVADDENQRWKIKRQMVRIGNRVKIDDERGELIGETDIQGLREVSRQTERLLDESAKFTWIAAQAVDISTKIHATTKLILRMTKKALIVKPFVFCMDSLTLLLVLHTLEKNICKLWRVPTELRKALWSMYFRNEGYWMFLRQARHDTEKIMKALGALIMTVVSNAIFPVPALLAVYVTGGILLKCNACVMDPDERHRHKTTGMIITYALNLLLAILFMKAQQGIKKQAAAAAAGHEPWDPALTQSDYMSLCEEFLKTIKTYIPDLEQGGGTAISSTWDVMFRSENVARLVDNFAAKQYKMYFRDAHDNNNDDSHVASTRHTNHEVSHSSF